MRRPGLAPRRAKHSRAGETDGDGEHNPAEKLVCPRRLSTCFSPERWMHAQPTEQTPRVRRELRCSDRRKTVAANEKSCDNTPNAPVNSGKPGPGMTCFFCYARRRRSEGRKGTTCVRRRRYVNKFRSAVLLLLVGLASTRKIS